MKRFSQLMFLQICILSILFLPFSAKDEQLKARDDSLQWMTALDEFIRTAPDLEGAISGISVRDTSDTSLLYEHQADIRLTPASNMKLLTSAIALDILGETHTFPTDIWMDGSIQKKTLHGSLYLRGTGDPTLLEEDFAALAKQVKKAGIHTIRGQLAADDTWFDDTRYSIDLPWSDEDQYYGAQISALTASPNQDYDAGTVILEVKPGKKAGQKAAYDMIPKTDVAQVINQVKTVPEGEKKKISFKRSHGTNKITLTGTIPVKASSSKQWVALWDPSVYALDLMKRALKAEGIQVKGPLKSKQVPKKAKKIASHTSMPLSELLVPMMKLSNNTHAEILLKELGKKVKNKGSFEAGLDVMNERLPAFGIDPSLAVLRDGSGISPINLVSANQFTLFLTNIQKEKWFKTYEHALPLAGASERMVGGTLRNRLKEPATLEKVRAKTGSLTTVSTLSGYIDTQGGKTLAFSILFNHLVDDEKGKEIEDRIVSILAENL
ncbi:D-alanyl-D-alanine carboxypeptidase/D-alanyl-D-alanine endopeptidase [Bacillus safensis]|uniref:D-alanyl-D-alanine carboxypeptidase/D-alanyl-D-alanine endopeptidase n=1 Tax=Bacillus safensis TaxID=561879 RepID=UPI0020A7E923|nr:D-alanyl-D-alanine carboxypeptidase/D-alanyl-D-alanine-endopeptidase [Bacillus safensis]USY27462.1 D-alanyl-D-alanine carboxypeptidase/D-alanyl-D-alanine-endopeptidase [Bacillus safensis]